MTDEKPEEKKVPETKKPQGQPDAIPGATAQDPDAYFATHTPALTHEPATPEPRLKPDKG